MVQLEITHEEKEKFLTESTGVTLIVEIFDLIDEFNKANRTKDRIEIVKKFKREIIENNQNVGIITKISGQIFMKIKDAYESMISELKKNDLNAYMKKSGSGKVKELFEDLDTPAKIEKDKKKKNK